MRTDPVNFLHSLAKVLVARAAAQTPAVTLEYAATPRALWRSKAVEESATDPYSVLAIYPGRPLEWGDRPDAMSLQVMTIGSDDEAASRRARCLFECFLDSDAQPLRMLAFNGYSAADDSADGMWLLVAADPLQRPGLIGRTAESARAMYSFNVDLRIAKTN